MRCCAQGLYIMRTYIMNETFALVIYSIDFETKKYTASSYYIINKHLIIR